MQNLSTAGEQPPLGLYSLLAYPEMGSAVKQLKEGGDLICLNTKSSLKWCFIPFHWSQLESSHWLHNNRTGLWGLVLGGFFLVPTISPEPGSDYYFISSEFQILSLLSHLGFHSSQLLIFSMTYSEQLHQSLCCNSSKDIWRGSRGEIPLYRNNFFQNGKKSLYIWRYERYWYTSKMLIKMYSKGQVTETDAPEKSKLHPLM